MGEASVEQGTTTAEDLRREKEGTGSLGRTGLSKVGIQPEQAPAEPAEGEAETTTETDEQ